MRRSRFWMTAAFLVISVGIGGGLGVGCTADDKPDPRRARGDDNLSDEQRTNLKRYHGLRKAALQLLAEKRFGPAQDKVSRALLLAGQIFGPSHPLQAQTTALRGRIYAAMERFDLATDSFRSELRIWRRALNPGDNVVIAGCLHRIGVSLLRAGKATEAAETLSKAVAMRRATLDHGPKRLGKHYRDQTKPPREPGLAASLHAMAEVQWKLKAHAKAVALFREAIALRRKHLPSAHADTVASLAALAVCYETLGRYNLAAKLHSDIVAKLRAQGTPAATALPLALKRLADMSVRAGRTVKAEKQYKEAYKLAAAEPVPNKAIFLAELDSRLGILYARTNRATLAASVLRKALAVFQKDTKANAESVVRCLIQLAKLQRLGKELGQATKTIRRALNVVRKHQGHRTYSYARALAELGEVYAAQKAQEQAARILGRAFEIVHKLYGAKNPRTKRMRARLVALYTALGWKDKLRELPQ